MAVNGKDKGNTFERKISKVFSTRFKDITGIDNSFRRNSDSGSYFGGSNQKRTSSYDLTKATFGDIITPDNFLFSIECKHYKDAPSLNVFLTQSNKKWDSWIKQAEQDCTNSNLEFMLIIKYNNVNEFVFLKNKINDLDYIFKYMDYYAYPLEDLLKLPDSTFFKS